MSKNAKDFYLALKTSRRDEHIFTNSFSLEKKTNAIEKCLVHQYSILYSLGLFTAATKSQPFGTQRE